MFLIYNTVMFGVVQRRAVIGTLRLLGATGGQVFALVLLETAAASAVGTLLGLGLGWLLGQGAVRLVTQTINDLYYVVSVTGAPLTAFTVAKAVALGLGAGVLSAVAPALEAARVEPVEALRRSSFEGRARRLLPRVGAAGAVLAALGGLLLLASGRSLLASFAGLFAIVLGLALLAPLATVGAMSLATPIAGRFAGTLGRLATRTVTRSVSRTGVAVAALAVAVSVTIGVGLMIESFRSTVENWLDLTLRADVFIGAPSAGGARAFPTLSPDVPAKVAAVPGVAWVETFRSVRVASPLGEVNLGVADPRRARDTRLYRFAEGDPERAWDAVRAGAVIVTEPFAFRHRLPAHGATVTLVTDRGPRTFPVAGVFYDYATEQGTVFLTRNVYERYWDDRGVTSVGAHLAPGASIETVTQALRSALAGTALSVTPNRSLRAQALRIFDRTFAVTQALRLLAVVVAFIGVWSALMALQVERTRELATLTTLGLGERQQWALGFLETGLMGTVAGLLALPLGWLLAFILVNVINVRSFGWTMRLEADPWLFAQAFLVSVGAAMLASVYPLLRLRRRSLAEALRQEMIRARSCHSEELRPRRATRNPPAPAPSSPSPSPWPRSSSPPPPAPPSLAGPRLELGPGPDLSGFARATRGPSVRPARRPRPALRLPDRVVVLHRQRRAQPTAAASASSSRSSAAGSRPARRPTAPASPRTRSTSPTSRSRTWRRAATPRPSASRAARAAWRARPASRSPSGSRTGERMP